MSQGMSSGGGFAFSLRVGICMLCTYVREGGGMTRVWTQNFYLCFHTHLEIEEKSFSIFFCPIPLNGVVEKEGGR